MKHNKCDLLVRTCERTYDEQMILESGIRIIDIEFPDGSSPPKAIIKQWL
jgi:protein tyrosine phosphatase type IVA